VGGISLYRTPYTFPSFWLPVFCWQTCC